MHTPKSLITCGWSKLFRRIASLINLFFDEFGAFAVSFYEGAVTIRFREWLTFTATSTSSVAAEVQRQ